MTTTRATSNRNSLANDLRHAMGPGYQVPTITRTVERHLSESLTPNHQTALGQHRAPGSPFCVDSTAPVVETAVLALLRRVVQRVGRRSEVSALTVGTSPASRVSAPAGPNGCCPA